MKIETAIKRLQEGKPVGCKLILEWLQELVELRTWYAAERERALEEGY